MVPFQFLRQNKAFLGAGFALAMASAFGQTWFISLFSGQFRETFNLSHGEWGGIYTLATTASAILLIFAGKLADHARIRTLALDTIGIYALTCVGVAMATSPIMLCLLVFLLRFCGQGAMSHLAFTAMARWFARTRGRAISIAAMGFSVAEATFPILVVMLMGLIGWRETWLVAAGTLVLVFAPLTFRLLRLERTPQSSADEHQTTGLSSRHWSPREALGHWLYWALTPGVLAPPFILTAVFFHQVHLVEIKGWELPAFAASYPVFSGTTVVATLTAGWIVDRFTTVRVLPFYLLPMAAGMTVLALGGTVWTIPLAMVLFGMTTGGAHTVLGALWPEIYGTRNLGAIRALAVSTMVFASAIGPGLTGWLIDAGIGFEAQCLAMAGYTVMVAGVFTIVRRRIGRSISEVRS